MALFLQKTMGTTTELLQRGVAEVHVEKELEKLLESGKKLRVKFGIDPTGSDLHLGHLVPLKKLAAFQKAGHEVILLFGTFTGKIGDPTGKDKLRKPLTDEDIAKNMETYLEQANKVLDTGNIEIVKNGDWLAPMSFADVLELAGTFTVQQMIQRDMFQKRIEEGKDINLVEFFYPLMQGYDSVPIRADVEIGGTDQLFNLMAGRKIQEKFGQKPQHVITVPILEGTDGKEKMSKSLGNYIAVFDSPTDVFGKTMSIPDDLMEKYFELVTNLSKEEYTEILAGHPRDAKLRLARELTILLHDEAAADAAKEEFLRMFQQGGRPDEIPEILLTAGDYSLLDLVIASHLCSSNGEARRMIQQGAVKVNDEKKDDMDEQIILSAELMLQVGRRKFCKIRI